jgi:hypothetical protein
MGAREREGDWYAAAERRADHETAEVDREGHAAILLVEAVRVGPRTDPDEESERQFNIGFAAGVLGAMRFSEILLTSKRPRP